MRYPDDDDVCLCGHTYANHAVGGGSCDDGIWYDDDFDCPCMGFREE